MFDQKPLTEFRKIINVQHFILRLIGCDAFSEDFRFSFLTYLIIFMASFFMVISFIDLYIFKDDVFNFVFVLVTIFYGIIGCTRLGICLTDSQEFARLVLKTEETYQLASPDDREQQILLSYTKLLKQCTTLYTILFPGGGLLTGIMPLAVYLWNGQKILPFGVVLPFVDGNSHDGYQLNYLYQCSCILWTPPGLTASQNIFFALVFNICIQYDILILKLVDLDELVLKNQNGVLDVQVYEHFVQIVRFQQRLISFVADIEKAFSVQLFVEVSCNALQIVVTLFVMNNELWIPGLLIISIASFQLFLFCFLGTLIEVKFDQFTERIYSVSWHGMSNSDQKNLKFMLEKSQRSLKLTYGGMIPVNMNLFLSVYKKIYSVFMMLQNM